MSAPSKEGLARFHLPLGLLAIWPNAQRALEGMIDNEFTRAHAGFRLVQAHVEEYTGQRS